MERSTFYRGLLVLFVCALFGACLMPDSVAGGQPDGAARAKALQLFSATPAAFIENTGQIDDPSIRYAFYGSGANVFHTTSGPVFQVFQRERNPQVVTPRPFTDPRHPTPDDQSLTTTYSFSATFPGAKRTDPVGDQPQQGRINYYIGNDPCRWRPNVPTFTKVIYPGIWDGIDLHTFGRRSNLKYEFHVAPGADWRKIVIRYHGIDGLWVDAEGALHVSTPLGELVDDAPYAYQMIGGEQVRVAARFRLIDQMSYAFEIAGEVDEGRELVIDPDLAWGTFLGGSDYDGSMGISTDVAGNIFITGITLSPDFCIHAGFDASYSGGQNDAFVAKFTASGQLQWSSFLGGSNYDVAVGIAADAQGNSFITGATNSPDFPVPGGFDRTLGVGDAFVARVSATGQLEWATFLGGSSNDVGNRIAATPEGWAVVVGDTDSPDFPTPGGLGTSFNNGDAFVAKIDDGGQLQWARFLGGSMRDSARGVAVDRNGTIFVTGGTYSPSFPTAGGFDVSFNGECDGYIAKLAPSGQLEWASFLGGRHVDEGTGIGLDPDGNAFIVGYTNSPDFPMPGGTAPPLNGDYAFVAKVTTSGHLEWTTLLGGGTGDIAYSVVSDIHGNALVTGKTQSPNFPVPGGFRVTHNGWEDAFVAKLGASGELQWATFLGGKWGQYGTDITTDADGCAIVTGSTASPDFPTSYGFDTSFNGVGDAFIAKISFLPQITVQSASLGGVRILGDKTGFTPYKVVCGDSEVLSLIAPAVADQAGKRYNFVVWKLDGQPAPAGTTLTLTMDADHTATAIYEIQKHTLAIQSSPSGITITGDQPGTTDYTATCDDQQVVNLSAPSTATVGSSDHSFVRWMIDGVTQSDLQQTIAVLMDANHTAVAVYFKHSTLSVRSSPIIGINISGNVPGKTNYAATLDHQQTVNLSAQDGVFVGTKMFLFVRWMIDGVPQPLRQTSIQITMDTDHVAEAVHNLVGDVNGDCKINVLDLILVRNRLGQSTTTGDNWKADLDQDGRINVLDLILLRNRLGTGCL